MDPLSRNIASLERDLQLSQTNPTKIIATCIGVAILMATLAIWWVRPSSLLEKDNSISWVKTGQLMLAIGVAMVSILWILWNLFIYN